MFRAEARLLPHPFKVRRTGFPLAWDGSLGCGLFVELFLGALNIFE